MIKQINFVTKKDHCIFPVGVIVFCMMFVLPSRIHADVKFVDQASFVLMNDNSSIELGSPSKYSSWHRSKAQWSLGAIDRYHNGTNNGNEISLWALIAQDGDFVGFDESLVASGSGNVIDPSRFYIPENREISITEDTVIDGDGQTLELEPHARFTVDHNVTLTLRNMRIKSTRNSSTDGIFELSGETSRIALHDVELTLGGDTYFQAGHMFVHGDVIVTGTSSFVYTSTHTSFITDNATLGIGRGSTLFYYPGSTDNHLINMQSDTASIYLDGATLQTTHTGMRLSAGRLYLNNSVTLDSDALSEAGEQSIYTGIIFGDSSLGNGSGDLDVKMLRGAYVEVNGVVLDDSV